MERLDKLIASRGTLSRKDAQKQIRSGAVTVNGAVHCSGDLFAKSLTIGSSGAVRFHASLSSTSIAS